MTSPDDKLDEIRIYESRSHVDGEDVPASSRIRWTRRTTTNYKVVGASHEGYSRVAGAMANIKRTQKEPYIIVVDDNIKK